MARKQVQIMWSKNWRETIWSEIETQDWDLFIIGGGITGAGIFREATRLGYKALLIDQNDFAWGTSSRSSKLVHGGFRYLKEGKIGLTRASVGERDHLLDEGAGLIDPLGFLMTIYKGDHPGKWTMKVGLSIYDLLALRWNHETYDPQDFRMLAPHVSQEQLVCGFRYGDALTDDARLVIRLIKEAAADGGMAINYTRAEELLWRDEAQHSPPMARGALLQDQVTGRRAEVSARVIINATGAWADRLRAKAGASPRIRPLRGSHLIFPAWRLPVAQAIALWHPIDGRPVFVFPWEGITLIGTTDVDHRQPLDEEPSISPEEAAYLMAAVEALFPSLNLTLDDAIATYSGVRPVIGTGKLDPSKESREHVIWEENGLLTVTGGKLTTFRLIAHQVLEKVAHRLPNSPQPVQTIPVLEAIGLEILEEAKSADGLEPELDEFLQRRLVGRYGAQAPALIASAPKSESAPIPGTQILWAELRWAARAEGVVHLDDLLLRRVRLGLLLPEGGKAEMPAIRQICQEELGWDHDRWESEEQAYLKLWEESYRPPQGPVPDWKAMLAEARKKGHIRKNESRWNTKTTAGVLLGLAFFLAALSRLRRPSQRVTKQGSNYSSFH
jgi:glycerol-3-phosphate dehydrogenase